MIIVLSCSVWGQMLFSNRNLSLWRFEGHNCNKKKKTKQQLHQMTHECISHTQWRKHLKLSLFAPYSCRGIGDFPSTAPASPPDGPGLMLCSMGLQIPWTLSKGFSTWEWGWAESLMWGHDSCKINEGRADRYWWDKKVYGISKKFFSMCLRKVSPAQGAEGGLR